MTLNVYPSITGYVWTPTIAPVWNSQAQKTVSGRVVAATYQQYPLYKFQVKYATLSQSVFDTLLAFFNQQQGNVVPFWFDAGPGNDSVTAQPIGTGDGTTTTFQLLRSYGGFSEPIAAANGAPSIYENRYGAPELLSAASRVNLVYPSTPGNGWGISQNATITTDAGTAPDGSATASELTDDTTDNDHSVWISGSTGTGYYTHSVWLKYVNHQYAMVSIDDGGNGASVTVDLVNGTISATYIQGANFANASATITSFGSGWYRVSITTNYSGPAAYLGAHIAYATSGAPGWYPAYIGTGSDHILAWGAQLESGSTATALIATTTATASNGGADYSLSSTSPLTATMSVAPASGVALTWTGNYYFQCRFSKGTEEFEQFMYQLYKTKSVSLETYW